MMAAESRGERAPTRTFVRWAVLLVAAYLAVDVATPLLPGAFRFDPRQSVDAAARIGLPAVPGPAAQPARLPAMPDDGPPPPSLRRVEPPTRHFTRALRPPDREGLPSPSDDD